MSLVERQRLLDKIKQYVNAGNLSIEIVADYRCPRQDCPSCLVWKVSCGMFCTCSHLAAIKSVYTVEPAAVSSINSSDVVASL